LRQPLPIVRIEVTPIAAWPDLTDGLRALGFSVLVGRDTTASATVVRITEQIGPRDDKKSAFIVVSNERSFQGLKDAMDAGASGYFAAPIDSFSLGAAICAAAGRSQDLSTLSERTARLHESLTADQTVSTVVGILMERYRFSRADAYERLRRYARTERRKVVEVAAEIVTATEELSKTMRAIESVARDNP